MLPMPPAEVQKAPSSPMVPPPDAVLAFRAEQLLFLLGRYCELRGLHVLAVDYLDSGIPAIQIQEILERPAVEILGSDLMRAFPALVILDGKGRVWILARESSSNPKPRIPLPKLAIQ